jgi:hypothetical protein
MRLVISRSQEDMKGVFGWHKGVQFTLRYRLQLTSEEAELVQRYGLGSYALTPVEMPQTAVPGNTIQSLVAGHTSMARDLTKLLAEENAIKEACDQLPILFEVCRSFGGEETIADPQKKSEPLASSNG